MQVLRTTGNRAFDEEINRILSRVTALENVTPAAASSASGLPGPAGAQGATGPAGTVLSAALSTPSTIANTAAETLFTGAASFNQNTLAVGQVLRVLASGVYSTDALLSGTLTFNVKIGSVYVASTAAITMTASLTNQGWMLDAFLIVASLGAGGTIEAQGRVFLETASGTMLAGAMPNTAVVTVDTTVLETLGVSVQWANAAAANSITLRQLVVESLK